MAAVLKPSVNVFALLESDDPGDTRLANVGAKAKADAAASRSGNGVSKKQQPQMSAWKINKLKAEAEAAAKQQQQQQLADASTKTNTAGNNRRPQQQLAASTKTNAAGNNNRKPHQPATVPSKGHVMTTGNNFVKDSKPQRPAVPSRAQVSAAANAGMSMKPKQPSVPSRAQVGTAANAAMNMKPKQPAAASTAHVNTTANAGDHEQYQQQQPVAPALGDLGDQLFAYANSVRTLIYKNRKQNAKEGVAGGAPTDDEKGGHPKGASAKNDVPGPVQEETLAPVQPVLAPPPPPSLEDSAQFPSLKLIPSKYFLAYS